MSVTTFATHVLFGVALFCVSVLMTQVVLRFGVLDEPNDRSSHDRPTPSSGGLAIVFTFFVGFAVVWAVSSDARLSATYLAGFGVASLGIALVGLVDDLKLLKTFKLKLAVQFAAALVLVGFDIVFTRASLPGIGVFSLGWLGYPLTVLWVVGMTNVFNFMDGLNGLAAGTAVIVAGFLCVVTFGEGSYFVYIFCYIFAAGAAGFLVFNFPRARLFMGDVGSQFLGFSFATLAVIAAEIDVSRTSLLVVPLLFFNFIFDTAFTFARRVLRGENVMQAHRTHLYQLMNRLGFSHVRVSLFHYGVAAAQGGGALVLVRLGPDERALVFLPYLVFQILYAAVVIGSARRRGLI